MYPRLADVIETLYRSHCRYLVPVARSTLANRLRKFGPPPRPPPPSTKTLTHEAKLQRIPRRVFFFWFPRSRPIAEFR